MMFQCVRQGVLLMAALLLAGCDRSGLETVVVYTSQDQHFAEPIFRQFQARTGIKVRALYDSEAVKTVGLANRLIAEKANPQCDLWWSNEALRTRQLAKLNILDSNAIADFGFRSRRLVINTNRLSPAAAPQSLLELTNATWKRRIALAYPMFGTTSAHFLALRRHWGQERWEQWCRALAANEPFLVDGNSVVVRFVARGEAVVGLTDFDDIVAGRREKLPVMALPLTVESLLIPNSVGLLRGSPHPVAARRLFDYLQSNAVVEQLIAAAALEGNIPPLSKPRLAADWDAIAGDLQPATDTMRGIFLR
jgi:iron(III) transport system substrate-binding protein